jgi:hypothetical protein
MAILLVAMSIPRSRLAAAAAPFLLSLCACAGPSSGVILYEGPDRPGGEEVEGPAPPSDYNFGPTRREVDLDGDQKRDRIEYVSNGKVNGVGLDTNHDGKMDRYQKIVKGKVVEETRDTDFDGVLDLRLIDTDDDGTLDKAIQLQAPLNGKPVPPQPGKNE